MTTSSEAHIETQHVLQCQGSWPIPSTRTMDAGIRNAGLGGRGDHHPSPIRRESVRASGNETAFMTVLTGDFSFSDRKRNDQVERFKPQAVHVTHWDIGLFGDLKTGSRGHWVKWTTAWASEATGGRATGNFASQCSQDLGRWRPMWYGLCPTGPGARAEPEGSEKSC